MSVENKAKINIGVNGIHVMSVKGKTKINIAVSGIHVVSVESKIKINIAVNGIHVVSVESKTKINIAINGIHKTKLILQSMGFMSWVLKVLIALRLISVMATYQHVMSVENKAKINIGVNGDHVVTVESFDSSEANCCNRYLAACLWFPE